MRWRPAARAGCAGGHRGGDLAGRQDASIKVLIFHGYLLRGTGSNIYNANVARALARLGHDVHLLCQEPEAEALGWIDAVGRWRDGALKVEPIAGSESPGEGSITAYLPEIGGLLPVYVEDRYSGFRVKAFTALSDAELNAYIEANVRAVNDVVEAVDSVDAALANHLVIGPLVLARAGLEFAAKVHGSALSYTVRPNPRFLPHAREGLAAAAAVLVGSRHTAISLFEVIRDAGVERKTRLGPPGVDVEEFAPAPRDRAAAALEELAECLAAGGEDGGEDDSFSRDGAEAAVALRHYAGAAGPRVVFVGKLIASKGCELLLASWPLVAAANPGARLLIGGFGAYREGLERLWAAIESGDEAAARWIAERGRALEGGEEAPLEILDDFLRAPPSGWWAAAQAAAGSVAFSGRLEHAEVAEVVAASDAMVVPSTFPEAFGMVAAEAAATGAMPVCADHSGLAEVAAALDRAMPDAAKGIAAFPLDGEAGAAVTAIAARLSRWLALGEAEREAAEAALRATVVRRWSWERVAENVLAASAGSLSELDPVPSPEGVLTRSPGAGRNPPPSQ